MDHPNQDKWHTSPHIEVSNEMMGIDPEHHEAHKAHEHSDLPDEIWLLVERNAGHPGVILGHPGLVSFSEKDAKQAAQHAQHVARGDKPEVTITPVRVK